MIINVKINFSNNLTIKQLATHVKLDSYMALLKCLATLQPQAVQFYVDSQFFI